LKMEDGSLYFAILYHPFSILISKRQALA